MEPLDSIDDDEAIAALWDQVAARRDAEMDADPSLVLDARLELQRLMIRYGA